MFEKFLKRSSWTDIVISIIFVLFGALLIAKPSETLGAISIILGIVFIAMGVFKKLVEYYTSETKEDYLLTIALITVILGVIILFASDAILSIFRVILGIWIIAAIMDFQTVLVWKQVKSPYWTASVLFSILIMLAGIFILINKNILLTTMGIIIVVYGILDIIDRIIFMKKINDYIEK